MYKQERKEYAHTRPRVAAAVDQLADGFHDLLQGEPIVHCHSRLGVVSREAVADVSPTSQDNRRKARIYLHTMEMEVSELRLVPSCELKY